MVLRQGAMRALGAVFTRRIASDQGITREKVHLFEGLCENLY